MIEKVISGGQTGADIAGVRAAKALNIPTGGWMPKGFKTLAGNKPEYAELYGMKEMPTGRYPARTRSNVIHSDATLQFAENWDSPGEILTTRLLDFYRKPHMRINVFTLDAILEPPWVKLKESVWTVRMFLHENDVEILNVAGNTEKTCPGIEEKVFAFMLVLLTADRGEE